MLKFECDALRRELNEWHDRVSLLRVEEPIRGEGFRMILSGEAETLSVNPIEEEDGNEYGDDGYSDEEFSVPDPGLVIGMADDRHGEGNLFARKAFAYVHPGLHLQTILPCPANGAAGSPMTTQSPTGVSFKTRLWRACTMRCTACSLSTPTATSSVTTANPRASGACAAASSSPR